MVDRLDLDVRVATEARATLERQYYGGHDVLFPDAATACAGHVDMVERLTMIAELMPSTSSGKARGRRSSGMSGDAFQAGVADRVASLIDDAKVRAYEVLGDRLRAVAIMERRLLVDRVPARGDVPVSPD